MIVRLTREPAKPVAKVHSVALAEMEGDEVGLRSNVVFPICQGALTEGQLSGVTTFRCHVGHAFSPAALLAEQAESLERALWAAVRALEESAGLARRMSHSESGIRGRLDEKSRTQMHHADVVRRMLLSGATLTQTDESPDEHTAASGGRKGPTGV